MNEKSVIAKCMNRLFAEFDSHVEDTQEDMKECVIVPACKGDLDLAKEDLRAIDLLNFENVKQIGTANPSLHFPSLKKATRKLADKWQNAMEDSFDDDETTRKDLKDLRNTVKEARTSLTVRA